MLRTYLAEQVNYVSVGGHAHAQIVVNEKDGDPLQGPFRLLAGLELGGRGFLGDGWVAAVKIVLHHHTRSKIITSHHTVILPTPRNFTSCTTLTLF